MLNDATGLKKIYLAAGYTDLRRGMDDALSFLREEDGPNQGTLMGRVIRRLLLSAHFIVL